MIEQLCKRLIEQGLVESDAAALVLTSDALDLAIRLENVWDAHASLTSAPIPAMMSGAHPARIAFRNKGLFGGLPSTETRMGWNHLGYSFAIENTRAIQILQRVITHFRQGESLGIPSAETLRWLETAELFQITSHARWPLPNSSIEPEAERRNAYWRLFGLDLAFGTDSNLPSEYERSAAANVDFAGTFSALLAAIHGAPKRRPDHGTAYPEDEHLFQLAENLRHILRARRKNGILDRIELVAATALGWAELTLREDSPLVIDLDAHAQTPGERLRLIGLKVGLPPHAKSDALLRLAPNLSIMLRCIESGVVSGPDRAWVLYSRPVQANDTPSAIGTISRKVAEDWAILIGGPNS